MTFTECLIAWGIGGRATTYPYQNEYIKQHNGIHIDLSKIEKKCCIDMLFDTYDAKLKHTKVAIKNDKNNISVLSGIPSFAVNKGFVPHIVLGNDMIGAQLRIAQIPNDLFGKHIQNLF